MEYTNKYWLTQNAEMLFEGYPSLKWICEKLSKQIFVRNGFLNW